jgi:MFS family permease
VSGEPSGEEPGGRRLRPTSAAVLAGWGIAGLVGGWLLHPLAERARGTAPVITWAQPLALILVAAILGATAYLTWRSVHVHHEHLEPYRAVNRLVLARACALVGALVAGGYAGYALSWIGVDTDLADERVVRAAVSALAGLAIVATSLALERACRVSSDENAL